jgi:endonuclease/exonuclease/phosphatase family metal-dependent hydrolase
MEVVMSKFKKIISLAVLIGCITGANLFGAATAGVAGGRDERVHSGLAGAAGIARGAAQVHPISSIWEQLARGSAVNPVGKQNLFIQDCISLAAQQANAGIPAHKKNDATVRFATYNVHFWTDPMQVKNYDLIMKVIGAINADILVLQEVSMFDEALIRKNLAALGYGHIEFLRAALYRHPYGMAPFGNIVASKYPLSKTSLVKSFDIDRERIEKRGFINACVALPGGKSVSVYGTHLDVFDETEKRRKAEMEELLKIAHGDSICNVCIMADCNALRSQDYQDTVINAGGKSVKIWDLLCADDVARIHALQQIGTVPEIVMNMMADQGFKDCFTAHGVPGPKFSSWPGKLVDFIQLNRGWNLPIKGCYMMYTPVSDHCPIIMDVDVRATIPVSAVAAGAAAVGITKKIDTGEVRQSSYKKYFVIGGALIAIGFAAWKLWQRWGRIKTKGK